MTRRSYLDHNATTPLLPEAREAMLAGMELTGSASSVHAEGRAVRRLIEAARADIAGLLSVPASEVVFTSGASEANAMALSLDWQRRSGSAPTRALISAIEHASVLSGGRLAPESMATIPVTSDGVVDLAALEQALSGEPALVSVMLANNETGAIQPMADIATLVRRAGGLLHCDAAQALGKIEVSCAAPGPDLVSVSSHKIGGPAGVGALIISGALHPRTPLIRGGGQEQGRRAGTENLAGILGFAAAARVMRAGLEARSGAMRRLRDRLEAELRALAPGLVVFSDAADRLPNTTCFSLAGQKAETALIALDLKGIAVSSGSACSSGKVGSSHVLAAMGVADDLARGALRVSVGPQTTDEDVNYFVSAWKTVLGKLHGGHREQAA